MATTSQKWLIGCGIGCAAVIVIVVGLITGTIVYVRGRFQPLQQASESRREIVTALGEPEAFVPAPNGAIAPDRMETFLSVREALRESQDRLDSAFAGFDPGRLNQRHPSFGEVFRLLTDIGNMIIPIGEYVSRRNQILLDKRMALGEYAYIYSIAFHSWLGHPVTDGPAMLAEVRRRDRVSMNDPAFAPEGVRRQYRRLMMSLLENQLEGIKSAEASKLRDGLKQEIDRLDRNPDRVAWEDNLPPAIDESLKPYRSRLEATYRPSANYFELLTVEELNQVQWGARNMETGQERGPGPVQAEAPETVPRRGGETGKERFAGDIAYQVGSGVTAPVPLERPAPPYTDEARNARISGTVTVRGMVRKDGSVGNLSVVGGLGYGLDESALNTIATRWRFKPGMRNGAPVEVEARIEVIYRLR